MYTGVNAKDPNTLVVFDEIQECPRALTSLKSFAERSPETALVAAGSLLGVALHRGVSFPVGKVDHLLIYPLSFDEFLLATGNNLMLDTLRRGDLALADSLSERYIEQLRNYYFVGGMPEVVQTFLDTGSFSETRKQQNRLLFDYEHDFSKYADAALAEKIRLVWNSAPGQLARENKKFVYSAVRTGARARGYEEAIQWLVDAGLLLRVNRITKPGLPLSAYEDRDAFKIYLLDVGLLGAASRLDASVLVDGHELFSEFKGALTENYVCQELGCHRQGGSLLLVGRELLRRGRFRVRLRPLHRGRRGEGHHEPEGEEPSLVLWSVTTSAGACACRCRPSKSRTG